MEHRDCALMHVSRSEACLSQQREERAHLVHSHGLRECPIDRRACVCIQPTRCISWDIRGISWGHFANAAALRLGTAVRAKLT